MTRPTPPNITGLTARHLWEQLALRDCAPHAVLGPKEPDVTAWAARRLSIAPDRTRQIVAGPDDWVAELLDRVPDEFAAWVRDTIEELRNLVEALERELLDAVVDTVETFDGDHTDRAHRGRLVAHIKVRVPGDWQLVLAALDGQLALPQLWRRVRPTADHAFHDAGEDAA